jgi:hypothetical protein
MIKTISHRHSPSPIMHFLRCDFICSPYIGLVRKLRVLNKFTKTYLNGTFPTAKTTNPYDEMLQNFKSIYNKIALFLKKTIF